MFAYKPTTLNELTLMTTLLFAKAMRQRRKGGTQNYIIRVFPLSGG